MTKVFIDTNVWFSAFYKSVTAEKILKAHVNKKIQAVFSQKVLKELVKNISRKIPAAVGPLQIFLESSPPTIIKDPEVINPPVKALAHKKDQLVLQAAIVSQSKYLVTGNLKHFQATRIFNKFKLQILSPAQMVKLFKL